MLEQLNLRHSRGIPVADVHDRQHKEIKRKQQSLRTAIIDGAGMDHIIASAKELIAATHEHFESEERAMDAEPLPSFATHRRMHIDMIESLKDISRDLEHRRIRGALELMKFFDLRLIYHLDVEDATLERELKNAK